MRQRERGAPRCAGVSRELASGSELWRTLSSSGQASMDAGRWAYLLAVWYCRRRQVLRACGTSAVRRGPEVACASVRIGVPRCN